MGFFNWSSADSSESTSNHTANDKGNDTEIPKDLSEYLDSTQTSVSDREFKNFLQRNHQNEKSEEPEKDDIEKVQGSEKDEVRQQPRFESQPKVNPNISPFKSKYDSTETEIYKRENPMKEAVLTNCSEIQYKFMECLRKKSTVQKLIGMAKGGDECSMLADFLSSCLKVQKMALVMFDYASLDNIEEMESAKARVDRCFTGNFKDLNDVQDDAKYLKYTQQLKHEREEFYNKFGK